MKLFLFMEKLHIFILRPKLNIIFHNFFSKNPHLEEFLKKVYRLGPWLAYATTDADQSDQMLEWKWPNFIKKLPQKWL